MKAPQKKTSDGKTDDAKRGVSVRDDAKRNVSAKGDAKRWLGWFRPLSRPRREGPLWVAPAEILPSASFSSNVIISVPRACGTAVQRNRFRRIVKAYYEKAWGTQPFEGAQGKTVLWIRLQNHYKLERVIRVEEWSSFLHSAGRGLGP